MAQPPSPAKLVTNPRIAKLIELEQRGVIKPEHQAELNTYRAQGFAPPAANLTGEERTSAFLATRVAGGIDDVATALKDNPDAARPSFLASALGFTDGMRKALSGSERKRIEDAQLDILDSALTLGTGAAYNKEQLSGYRSSYFPGYLDDEKEVAAKKVRLQRLLEAAKLKAGGAAPQIEQALAKLNEADPTQPAATAHPDDPNAPSPGAKVEVPIIEAGAANIIGPSTGKRATIDIADQSSAQSPEFRAGLAKLLTDESVSADQIREYWSKNANGAAAPETPAAAEAAAPLAVERGKNGVTDRIDPFFRGAGDTLSLGFADELSAAGRTVFGNKTMAENLAAERGVDTYDTQNHGVMRFLGQLGGGAILPMGEAPTAGSLAVRGGAYGAGYGFGSTNGSLQDRFIGAGVGGVTGAAGGYGLGKLSELYQGRGPTPPNPGTGNDVADAAARRNIPVIAADVAPGARGATSFLESMPFAGGVVRRRMRAGNDAIEAQVGDLANGVSAPDRISVGEGVQGAAQQWVPRSKDIGSRLFEKIPIPRRSRAVVDKTREALGELTQDMESNPELSKIWVGNPRLKATLDALTSKDVLVDQPLVGGGKGQPLSAIQGGELSWGDMKRLRSIVGEIAGSPSLGSDGNQVAAMKKLYAALSADMETTALKSGAPAHRAFQKANDFWRQREARISDVLSKVIGPDPTRPMSGEAVMSQIERWSSAGSGSSARLQDLFSSLGRDERDQVAATIAHSLGRQTPDAEFSAQRFFTQVGKMSNRSRAAIFGRKGAEALSDLATVAEGRAGTIAKLNNSGSGRVSNYLQSIKGLMGMGGGAGLGAAAGIGAPTGAALTAGALGIGNISARLLTNPAVARWAAQGLRVSTVQGARNSIERLGQIATSNPAIRSEVLSIQKALAQAVNDNAPQLTRAAASNGKGPYDEQ